MEGIICVTYRCNARCYMCNTWKYPTKPEEEIRVEDVEKLPGGLKFVNVTGGEPFLRKDLEDIVGVAMRKSKRVVISTNGYFTNRTVKLAERFPKIGVRISLEGLPKANDELRGIKDGFDHGLRTLVELKHMGLKDIGFGITVSDRNAKDMIELYKLAKGLNVEFATAITHNTYYFHKFDNVFHDPDMIADEFRKLIRELFKTKRLKNWYRAYFNHFLINKLYDGERPLPCEMGTDVFMLDPFGEIRPCNGLEISMGNIRQKSFDEIWNSPEAKKAREAVANCKMNCWMIGSVSPAMKKAVLKPTRWILRYRGRYLRGEKVPVPALECQHPKEVVDEAEAAS
jgi:MoaA/NifB/PqqE/SkfB family radical SAM enzyme